MAIRQPQYRNWRDPQLGRRTDRAHQLRDATGPEIKIAIKPTTIVLSAIVITSSIRVNARLESLFIASKPCAVAAQYKIDIVAVGYDDIHTQRVGERNRRKHRGWRYGNRNTVTGETRNWGAELIVRTNVG